MHFDSLSVNKHMSMMNKRYLAQQLDTLATNVAKRGIYVVDQRRHNINIIDYIDKSVKLKNIPNIELAQYLCSSMNNHSASRNIRFDCVQDLLDKYNRLLADTVFYRYTIKHTRDDFKREAVVMRLDVAVYKLKGLAQELKRIC